MYTYILILTVLYGADYSSARGGVAITSIKIGGESSCAKAGTKWASEVMSKSKNVKAIFTCNKVKSYD